MIDFGQFKTAHRIQKFEGKEIISETVMCVEGNHRAIKIDAKTEYTPKAGDKLFFLNGCNVQRTKVRDHCKIVGSSITKTHPEQATAIFYGPESLSGIMSSYNEWSIPKDGYIRWLQTAANLCYHSRPFIEAELEKVKLTEHNFVFLGSAYSYVVSGAHVPFEDEDGDLHGVSISLVDTSSPEYKIVSALRSEEKRKYDPELLNSPLLYTQESILKHLNSMIITLGMSKELDAMLESKDQDNVVMAMEIMANCDYDKSLPYLIGLFNRNHANMSRCRVWDHVNFSALKDYMGVQDWSRFSLDKSKELLIAKGQGTRENMLLLVEIMTGYKAGQEPSEEEELDEAEKLDEQEDNEDYEQSIREEEEEITATDEDES